MKEDKAGAEYYRIGLLTALLNVADVVAWADRNIAGAEKPTYIFIELSLMKEAPPDDICRKLHEFPGEVDKFRIIRKVLADMHSSLRANPRRGASFARGLFQLYADCSFEVPQELEPISWLDEQPHGLADFLKPFAESYWKEFTDYYIKRLKGPDGENAYHSLVEADDLIIPNLIDVYRIDKDPSLRSELVKIIWQHRNPEAIEFLSEALNDPVPEVWKSALDGLVCHACPRAIETLHSARSRVFPKKKQSEEFQRWLEEAIEQAEDRIKGEREE